MSVSPRPIKQKKDIILSVKSPNKNQKVTTKLTNVKHTCESCKMINKTTECLHDPKMRNQLKKLGIAVPKVEEEPAPKEIKLLFDYLPF